MAASRTSLRQWATCSVILVTAGCAAAEPVGSTESILEPARSSFGRAPKDLRGDLERIANTNPSFAGVWFDQALDRIVVGVAGGEASPILPAVREAVDASIPSLKGKGIITKQLKYSRQQLRSWETPIRTLFSIDGVLSTSSDDRGNRFRIGVADSRVGELVRASLAKAGVPEDATYIAVESPTIPLANLSDKRRPTIENGFRVTTWENTGCTHGGDVVYSGVKGFVSAGHCRGGIGVAGGYWTQNTKSLGNIVGVEVVDPAGFTGGVCPVGKTCRYTDAAWIAYGDSNYYAGKKIAETVLIDTNFIAGIAVGRYRQAPYSSNALQGMWVRKTGSYSGTTEGEVMSTCYNSNFSGTSIHILCSVDVQALAGPGDSGAPVYLVDGNDALHLGTLWGGRIDSGTGLPRYSYSTWQAIASELNVWY